MVFKSKQILKPTAEQIAIMNLDSSGKVYTIAQNTVNGNRVVYSIKNEIECLIFVQDDKNYTYIFSESLEKANERFGTEYTEEGWYVVNSSQTSATEFVGTLEISETEMIQYSIYASAYFMLLSQDYIPLDNGGMVKLLTEGKQCKNDITVIPLLQKKDTTENGLIIADDGYCGLESVNVNVVPPLQEKTAIANGEYVPDEGYYGLSKVSVCMTASGQAIDLANVVEVDEEVINNPTEDNPIVVKHDGQLYLLIKETE